MSGVRRLANDDCPDRPWQARARSRAATDATERACSRSPDRHARRVRPLPEGDLPEVAQTVAIIMDGNGRWAAGAALPVAAGHRAGTRALRRTVEAAIDLGVQIARRLRVLDRELGAPAGRGRRPDGDLRGDDRARAARPRGAGRAHALHRAPRPRARRAPRARMAELEDRDRRQRPARPLDRVRLRRPGGARRRPRGASSRAASTPRESTRTSLARAPLRAGAARPRPAHPHVAASCAISNFLLWQLAYAELVFVDRLWPDFDAARPARARSTSTRSAGRAVRRTMSASSVSRLLVGAVGAADRARRSSTSAAGGSSASSRSAR